MTEVKEYLTEAGKSPFSEWFDSLDPRAAGKVATIIERMSGGNFSNEKRLSSGISEYRINSGPGYRIYYSKENDNTIILLGGGTKQGQNSDIDIAQRRWNDHKQRRRREQ